MMFIGLILTLNRVHWAIFGGVLLVIGVVRERRLLAAFVVCSLLALLLFPSVANRAAQTLHFTSHLSDRDVLWRGAAALLDDHPLFGYGPGTFRQIFPFHDLLTDKEINGWHNDYLRIYLESGLVGVTAFVAWMGAIFWKGLRFVRRKDISGSDQTIAKAILAAIGTILVSSLVASAAFDTIILMLLSLLTAIFSTQLEHAPSAPTENAGQRSS
jgi:O-antigen ligase